MKRTLRVVALATVAMNASCLTVARGTHHDCLVTSTPSGAHFQLGEHQGVTPATIYLKRNRHRLPFSCGIAGHESLTTSFVPKELTGLGWGLVAFTSGSMILPGIIDLTSGATHDHPNQLHVTLVPNDGGISTVAVK